MDLTSKKSINIIKLHAWVVLNVVFIAILFKRPEISNIIKTIFPGYFLTLLLLRSSSGAFSVFPVGLGIKAKLSIVVFLLVVFALQVTEKLERIESLANSSIVLGFAVFWSFVCIGLYVWRLSQLAHSKHIKP